MDKHNIIILNYDQRHTFIIIITQNPEVSSTYIHHSSKFLIIFIHHNCNYYLITITTNQATIITIGIHQYPTRPHLTHNALKYKAKTLYYQNGQNTRPKRKKPYSNIYEEWTQPWPMGSKIYHEVHENPRAFFSRSNSILLESSIQYP